MPFASGRCGWFCASENSGNRSKGRQEVRSLLKKIVQHLQSHDAIEVWLNNVKEYHA